MIFDFNALRTTNSIRVGVGATTVFLAGGTPAAADNARLASQATLGGTTLQNYMVRLDP